MAEKIVSPGVFTKEVDQSFLPAGIAAIGAALIGPTVKGPAGIPTVVSSYSEYQQIFGDTFTSGSGATEKDYAYLTSYTAQQYLKYADTLTVVRVLAGAYSPATAVISSSTSTGNTYSSGSVTIVHIPSGSTDVSDEPDEVLATNCKFFQPRANVTSTKGVDADYIYRVPHINCALLYKSSIVVGKLDVIVLFVQPMREEQIRAHTAMCIFDDSSTEKDIRLFQQLIFGQDKPILENQHPKRLPLNPRMETPIRADKTAISYRRWLLKKGLKYGTVAN